MPSVEIDLVRSEIRRPGEPPERLTLNETRVLECLMARPGQTVPRADLLVAMGYKPTLNTRALANAVVRIRRKLGDDAREPALLKTVYGIGYRLEVPAKPEATAPPKPSEPDLVGRGAELAALEAALESSRIVTLVGIAGVGKTRLARQIAGDGTVFVDLTNIRAERALVSELARALDCTLPKRGSPTAHLGVALRRRGAIRVVLDNAEHIAGMLAEQLEGWSAASPGTRWLITSREPLRVVGEDIQRLEPLSAEDAKALLLRRAPHLDPDDPALDELARQLDGLPLALELGAARCRLLSPSQVVERIDSRFALLRGGREARGRSLEEALLWSWELLSAELQDALVHLAAYKRPFDLADAEALLGPGALDALLSLEEASWVSPSPSSPPIFRLLISVREFARAHGTPERRSAAREAHSEAILSLTEPALRGLHRGALHEGMAILGRNEEDLVAIYQQAQGRDVETAKRAALCLSERWFDNGDLERQRQLLQDAMALRGPRDDLWAHLARTRAGLLLDTAPAPEDARDVLDEALAAQLSPLVRVGLLRARAVVARRMREPWAPWFDEAFALLDAQPDPWHEGMLRYEQAVARSADGRLDEAEADLARARILLRRTGHQIGEACVAQVRADIAQRRDQLDIARDALAEAERIWAALGRFGPIVNARITLAALLLNHHAVRTRERHPSFDPPRALQVLTRCLELVEGETTEAGQTAPLHGYELGSALARLNRATAWLYLDDPSTAQEELDAAHGPLSKLGSRQLDAVSGLVQVAVHAAAGAMGAAELELELTTQLLDLAKNPEAEVRVELARVLIDPEGRERVLGWVPAELESNDEIVHLLVGLNLHADGG